MLVTAVGGCAGHGEPMGTLVVEIKTFGQAYYARPSQIASLIKATDCRYWSRGPVTFAPTVDLVVHLRAPVSRLDAAAKTALAVSPSVASASAVSSAEFDKAPAPVQVPNGGPRNC
jgi:hypothetical protein